MRAKKLLTSRQIFRYAVLARTVTKKALIMSICYIQVKQNLQCFSSAHTTLLKAVNCHSINL